MIEIENDELEAAVSQAKASLEKARVDIQVYASSVESARAEVAASEAKIKSAAADLAKSRINLEDAEREWTRAQELFKGQVISRAALDLSDTAYQTAANTDAARAGLAAARAAKTEATARLQNAVDLLASARANLNVIEAQLSVSQAKLAQALITCPMDATVVYLAVEPGETTAPGVALMTLVDMANLYVRVDVEASIVADLTLQANAVIRVQSKDEPEFAGRVVEIGQLADFATQRDVSRGRQDIKTFKVKIGIDRNDGVLEPGMSVMVDTALKERP
ncbi:HlyD family secretion protein [Desulfatitalea tepidiphila]|uniref:HlyD family secretion protein n=1 Tax=Desulfatitalea tepidiphila TaxID=1185843 RepID=UPI0006B46B1B|nr:efflux RND transporter periplasmic adaptor subunit [Desulfatitalea tepidiphila]